MTDIHTEFGLLGFTEEQMGGGNTAFQSMVTTERGIEAGYILITDDDTDMAPTDATVRFAVGYYDADGQETEHYRSGVTHEQALAFVREIDAMITDPATIMPLTCAGAILNAIEAIDGAFIAGQPIRDPLYTMTVRRLRQILAQKGCEHLDPAASTLTSLMDIVIDG